MLVLFKGILSNVKQCREEILKKNQWYFQARMKLQSFKEKFKAWLKLKIDSILSQT